MKFGVVVHGPEAIDSGMVLKVLDDLSRRSEVQATMGGAMGLAALLDAGLEDRVTVVPRQLVSDALRTMDRTSDVVVLLNRSKTPESGLAFGRLVVRRVINDLSKPLVQLDDGFFVVWRQGIGPLFDLARIMGMEEIAAPPLSEADSDRREVHGVRRGENIWINGTVIGKAMSERVVLEMRDGRLHFEGVEVKEHGLEKLKLTDLQKAIIRSGCVRRTLPKARLGAASGGSKLILIDHRAEDSIFRARGTRAAITVGDDTTRIATSLLARLGVPVIGIVDGDEDGICVDESAAPGSVVLRLRPGNDDQLGARVREAIFHGHSEMVYDGDLDALVAVISDMAGAILIEKVIR